MDDHITPHPDEERYLQVTPRLVIPRAELQFRTSRSSGPGGQHVNKVETRVELLFDLAHSPSVNDVQREYLLESLKSWLDNEGTLHIVSDRYRSQYRNREDTIERFLNLLRDALRPRKHRRPTRIPRSVREGRLQEKKQRGEKKRLRGRGNQDE